MAKVTIRLVFYTSGTDCCSLGISKILDTKMSLFLKVDKETTKIKKKFVRLVEWSTRNYWATVKPDGLH